MKKLFFAIILSQLIYSNCLTQTISSESAIYFYSDNNFTGHCFEMGLDGVEINDFSQPFNLMQLNIDWGAASHRTIPVIKYFYDEGTEYHVTIYELLAYTINCYNNLIDYHLSTHEKNYDNYCIDYGDFPLCLCKDALNNDYHEGYYHYIVHSYVPDFSIKNKVEERIMFHDIDAPNSAYVSYKIYSAPDEYIIMQGNLLNNIRYALYIEKAFPSYDGKYGKEYLSETEVTAINNGTFDLKTWCAERGLDISRKGKYYIRLWEFGYAGPLENAKELWVGDCHPNRVIDYDITESTIKSAAGTITASGTVKSSAGSVVFKAGERIIFEPGFKVEAGVQFEAKPESCTPVWE